jgi:hypothetical protein
MTSPDSGSPRPARVAGVALLGVAAVALVIGLVTVFGDSGDDSARDERPPNPPVTTSSRPLTSSTSTEISRPPSSSTAPSKPPSSSSAPTTTTTTSGQKPPGDGNGEPSKSVAVRVLNNSKIKGLAAKAADELRADGWQVENVGNYSGGVIPTTTVYFRPGTDEEPAARAIGAAFGMRVEPRFEGIQDSAPGVIVIVTNDYTGVPAGGGKNEG